MIQEYKYTQTVCDACGRVQETPCAIAGHYDSGWRQFEGKDLCMVCYGMFTYDIIEYLKEKEILTASLEKFMKKTKPYSGFGGFGVMGGFTSLNSGYTESIPQGGTSESDK